MLLKHILLSVFIFLSTCATSKSLNTGSTIMDKEDIVLINSVATPWISSTFGKGTDYVFNIQFAKKSNKVSFPTVWIDEYAFVPFWNNYEVKGSKNFKKKDFVELKVIVNDYRLPKENALRPSEHQEAKVLIAVEEGNKSWYIPITEEELDKMKAEVRR